MIIVRRLRGKNCSLPEEDVKTICLHELVFQTVGTYASLNSTPTQQTTTDPSLALDFVKTHLDLLANPYSNAQSTVVQTLSAIINHEDHLNIIHDNKNLFRSIIQKLHQNMNYNIILDCTVFKTPTNYLYPKIPKLTTYFLVIQTQPILSDATLIKNFSDIKRKYSFFENIIWRKFMNLLFH